MHATIKNWNNQKWISNDVSDRIVDIVLTANEEYVDKKAFLDGCQAIRKARNVNYLGTEHILLNAYNFEDSEVIRELVKHGFDKDFIELTIDSRPERKNIFSRMLIWQKRNAGIKM